MCDKMLYYLGYIQPRTFSASLLNAQMDGWSDSEYSLRSQILWRWFCGLYHGLKLRLRTNEPYVEIQSRPNPTMPRVAGFEILLLGFRGFLESYTRITLLDQVKSCLVRK